MHSGPRAAGRPAQGKRAQRGSGASACAAEGLRAHPRSLLEVEVHLRGNDANRGKRKVRIQCLELHYCMPALAAAPGRAVHQEPHPTTPPHSSRGPTCSLTALSSAFQACGLAGAPLPAAGAAAAPAASPPCAASSKERCAWRLAARRAEQGSRLPARRHPSCRTIYRQPHVSCHPRACVGGEVLARGGSGWKSSSDVTARQAREPVQQQRQ